MNNPVLTILPSTIWWSSDRFTSGSKNLTGDTSSLRPRKLAQMVIAVQLQVKSTTSRIGRRHVHLIMLRLVHWWLNNGQIIVNNDIIVVMVGLVLTQKLLFSLFQRDHIGCDMASATMAATAATLQLVRCVLQGLAGRRDGRFDHLSSATQPVVGPPNR